jgi:hypothetical protein
MVTIVRKCTDITVYSGGTNKKSAKHLNLQDNQRLSLLQSSVSYKSSVTVVIGAVL